MKKWIISTLLVLLSGLIFSCSNSPEVNIFFVTNCDTELDNISGRSGSKLELPKITNSNYDFLGWFLDEKFEKSFTESVFPEEDTILYAKWDYAEYAITLNFNNGVESQTLMVVWGKVVELPIPTQFSEVFLGWYYDEGCTNKVENDFVMPKKNLQLYANYESNSELVFVSPTGDESASGSYTNPITLESAVANGFKNIMVKQGEYLIGQNLELISNQHLVGIGNEVIFNFCRKFTMKILGNSCVVENLTLANGWDCGLLVAGSDNIVNNLFIINSLGRGIVLEKLGDNLVYGNYFENIEISSTERNSGLYGDGIYVKDNVSEFNVFDGIYIHDSATCAVMIENNNNYNVAGITIMNSILKDNVYGVSADDKTDYLNIRIDNTVILNNEYGIFTKSMGGLYLSNSTLYENGVNLYLPNAYYSRLDNVLSYGSNEDVYLGTLRNTILKSKTYYAHFLSYTNKVASASIPVALESSIFDSITFDYTRVNGELILGDFLKSNLSIGANLASGDYKHINSLSWEEKFAYIFDLEFTVPYLRLPKEVNGKNISSNLTEINNYYLLNGEVNFSYDEKMYEAKYPTYEYDLEVVDYIDEIYLKKNTNFTLEGIFYFDKYTNTLVDKDLYDVTMEIYFYDANGVVSKKESVATDTVGTYVINYLVEFKNDLKTYKYEQLVHVVGETNDVGLLGVKLNPDGQVHGNVMIPGCELTIVKVLDGSDINEDDVIHNANDILSKEIYDINTLAFEVFFERPQVGYEYYALVTSYASSKLVRVTVVQPTYVENLTEFKAAIRSEARYISLLADISLNEVDLNFTTYSGVILGNHYKLKDYTGRTKSLFTNLANCAIYDLEISNFSVNGLNNTGLLAVNGQNIKISNLKITNSTVSGKDNVGLFGTLLGDVAIDCLSFTNEKNAVYGSNSVGVIAGVLTVNNLQISNVYINTNINASGTASGLVGVLNLESMAEVTITDIYIKGNIVSGILTSSLIGSTNYKPNLKITIEDVVCHTSLSKNSYTLINDRYFSEVVKNKTYFVWNDEVLDVINNADNIIDSSQLTCDFYQQIFDFGSLWECENGQIKLKF